MRTDEQSENSYTGIWRIARQAGESITTVSRVLNGSQKVAVATREKVMAAVAHGNYRPNAAAKALSTGRTRTKAALIPTLEHSIFAVFIQAMEDEPAKAGYSLVIASHGFNRETEVERCNEVIRLGAEAMIVSGAQHSPALEELLETFNMPCLITSVYQPKNKTTTVGYDNRELGHSAIQYLSELGHHRIAVIYGPRKENDRMRQRVAGALEAEIETGDITIELNETSIDVGGSSAVLRDWIASNTLPDACLCMTDTIALGVLFEAQRQQINIPNAMAVMGFEDLDWAEHCHPRLTTIALPAAEMGKAAAASLVRHLDFGDEFEHQRFDAQIVERESTGWRS